MRGGLVIVAALRTQVDHQELAGLLRFGESLAREARLDGLRSAGGTWSMEVLGVFREISFTR